MTPKDHRHNITDPNITYEDFNNFLHFFYTDECCITEKNVETLLHLGKISFVLIQK